MKCSNYLKIVFRYTIVIIVVMAIKTCIYDMTSNKNLHDVGMSIFSNVKELKYEETTIAIADASFTRPTFDNNFLNDYVNGYIEENSCTDLTYNIYELGNKKVNLFLNCGNPKNIIYDYGKKEEINFDSLIIDYDKYVKKIKELSNLKYPTFVTDDINFQNVIYDIKPNELIAYLKTNEYGDIILKVNYNEIKDLLNIEMNFDDVYENEKFALDKNKKAIAFTFDDGPSGYDNELIDLLTAAHAKGTFFVVGNRLSSFPKVLENLVNSNMEVGNHTYDHKSLAKMKSEELKNEITKTNDLFYEMTNHELTLLRPSYGAVSKKVLLEVGMPVVLWNIDTLDWKSRNADKVYEEIITNAKDGDIVLMHSLYKSTVEAVDKSLKELYKMGFQVVSVSELSRLKDKPLLDGKSYLSIK